MKIYEVRKAFRNESLFTIPVKIARKLKHSHFTVSLESDGSVLYSPVKVSPAAKSSKTTAAGQTATPVQEVAVNG